jgi:hypothetical protein
MRQKTRAIAFKKGDRVERLIGGGVASPFGEVTKIKKGKVRVRWDKRLPRHAQIHTWTNPEWIVAIDP